MYAFLIFCLSLAEVPLSPRATEGTRPVSLVLSFGVAANMELDAKIESTIPMTAGMAAV